ncbi:MAG: 1-acyl-sn-glycerol-3-phosphate acyltransferase [Moraxellaceae bacterium]|nr:1-acyl-sn-glycerol-3-phosphate acyltransferase [Moraxellaceae bacterium]
MQKKSLSSKFFKKLHSKNHQVGQIASFATGSTMVFLNSALRGSPLWVVGSYRKLTNNKQADEFIINSAKKWIDYNNHLIDTILPKIDWQINLPDDLDPNKKYLLICNHQSWVDTSVIQYISHHPSLQPNLPLTRFFTKYNLIYIPFVGQAFYFLDFPMMKRFSQAEIAKNPQLKNSNLLEAKRACQLLKDKPFTLLNYLEGTRFNKEKHANQQSPYKHLLKPKAGGISLAISALGDEIDGILDMTIVYPEFQEKPPKYKALWKGDIQQIGVDIRHLQMPEKLFNDIKAGGYHNDEQTKKAMYAWLDELWQAKDKRIEQMLNAF